MKRISKQFQWTSIDKNDIVIFRFLLLSQRKKKEKKFNFFVTKEGLFFNHINVSPLGTCIENNSNDIQNKYKYLNFYCFILPLTMFIITPFTYQSYLDQGCASIYQQHI